MKIGLLLVLAGRAALAAPGTPVPPATPLVLAVHPYMTPAEILVRYSPLAKALADAIGRPVVVRVGNGLAEHMLAVGTDSVDLAYLGPAAYVTVVDRYGKRPLLVRQVVNGDPMLHSEIVVRTDSAIRTLQDLKGCRFAFGDRQSTAGHLLPAATMRRAGIHESDLATRNFLSSQRDVAIAVLAGNYDAGAVKEEVFQEFAGQGLRSIAARAAVPDHVFVASRKLPPGVVEALRAAMLQLGNSPQGRAALAAIEPGLNEFVPAHDSDYNGMRAIMRDAAAGN